MKRVSNVTMRKRLVTVFLLAIVVFLIIGIRLGYVQFILGDTLLAKAEDSWSRNITFEAERGKITDRNGEVLAENVSAPTVMVVPRQITDVDQTAENLAEILGMTKEKALAHITKKTSIERIHPEGRKISEEQALEIQMLNMDGVYIAKDSTRYYPNGDYLSHVLGFSGIDNQGLMGLESYYDTELSGEKGSLSFYSDAKGQRLQDMADVYTPPENGLDLQLTIDADIQTIVERELNNAVAAYNPDGAIALAVDPNNGEILAMSSRPSFNPENYEEADPDAYNRNLPIWSSYEPGSTFKIITLAAALEEKVVDLENDHFHDSGEIKVDGATLHCWKRGGHGDQTYLEVVQNSCNPGFVTLGQKLGTDRLFEYIKDFGFGEKTGVDLPGEGKGILFNPDNIGQVETATTAFGQGVSVTPIQQVMGVSAAINGGYLYQPHIAKSWTDPDTNEVVTETETVMKRRVISEDTSEQVRYALESVVAQGTGRGAYREGYRIGGKTGTAQKVGTNGQYLSNNYILSFVGFAPANDPQIVVYVAIDNPKDTIQFGGKVVAPIVGTIIEDSLRSMGVEPQKGGLEREYTWLEQEPVEVPDLVGMTTKELGELYSTLTIESSGEGNYIIDQAPGAGVKVESGSKLRIYLGEKPPE